MVDVIVRIINLCHWQSEWPFSGRTVGLNKMVPRIGNYGIFSPSFLYRISLLVTS